MKTPEISQGLVAPQARLELATLRLQFIRYFHNGPDYLFTLRIRPSTGTVVTSGCRALFEAYR